MVMSSTQYWGLETIYIFLMNMPVRYDEWENIFKTFVKSFFLASMIPCMILILIFKLN